MASLGEVVYVPAVAPEGNSLLKYQGFHPNEIVHLPRGHVKRPGSSAFAVDTTWHRDAVVCLRDGVKIYVDVFRPKEEEKIPAILVWSPYGKGSMDDGHQNYDTMGPARIGIPYNQLSGYERFEGPNPAEWTRRGYAVVSADSRGSFNSEGDLQWWNGQEAQDIHDTIDWISKQTWCTGSVVMMGNSWLGISQFNVASRCPHPALKAIAPWEGMTDLYRHIACRGGLPIKTGFLQLLLKGFVGRGRVEDPYQTMHKHHLLFDEYWRDKTYPVENIETPMYVLASYSTQIHSQGSFNAFNKAKTSHKWLRVHRHYEWHDLYRPESVNDLARFFDHFAKGHSNGWEKTPHVRLSLIGFEEGIARTIDERPEPADTLWPLQRTQMRRFYLDASTRSLSSSTPSSSASVSHEAHLSSDKSSFTLTFDRYTELSGWPWVRLYMSCNEHTDMDVVVMLRKVGVKGNALVHANYPLTVSINELPDVNVVKYLGPCGYLRASHAVTLRKRADEDMDYPEYGHERREEGGKGKVVALDIGIWPVGMVFERGESLRLDVAGRDLFYPETEAQEAEPDENVGRHVIHTGGEFGSFLMLPFIAG